MKKGLIITTVLTLSMLLLTVVGYAYSYGIYERGHLNAPSRESGDEKCLLPKAAQFVVQWRHGYKERESLCVRHEVPLGMGAEVSEVDTAGRDQRSGERVVQRDSTIPRV